MKKHWLALCSFGFALFCSVTSASALDCEGISIPDELAVELLNSQVAGSSHRINKRKTLVVNKVDSVTGTSCNIRSQVGVTLKRKIRRDASGHVILKGTLRLDGGKICIANTSVADVDVSNTLNIGEAVYKWVANKVLPNELCF